MRNAPHEYLAFLLLFQCVDGIKAAPVHEKEFCRACSIALRILDSFQDGLWFVVIFVGLDSVLIELTGGTSRRRLIVFLVVWVIGLDILSTVGIAFLGFVATKRAFG
jgi:hypothetical protein